MILLTDPSKLWRGRQIGRANRLSTAGAGAAPAESRAAAAGCCLLAVWPRAAQGSLAALCAWH